jgi:hypothetical protein
MQERQETASKSHPRTRYGLTLGQKRIDQQSTRLGTAT